MGSCLARVSAIAFAVFTLSIAVFGQTSTETKVDATLPVWTTSSAAYAELILKKTDLQSELEGLLLEYTDEYPWVKELKVMMLLLDRDILRIGKVKQAEAAKLSEALGKLMTRKVDLETELWRLQASYKDEHPEVKRAKKRIEIFETSIAQILK